METKKLSVLGVLLSLARRPPGRPPKERDNTATMGKRGGFWKGKEYFTCPGYGEPVEKDDQFWKEAREHAKIKFRT